MQEVSLDSRTVTSDGATGSLTNLIVDPSVWTLTHIVTDLQTSSRDFLVPVEYVRAASRPRLDLARTSHQLLNLPQFTSALVVTAGSSADTRALPMLRRRVPQGAIAFQRGSQVLSFEQEYVGQLQSVLVANADTSISHVVLHVYSLSRVVTLPIGAVQDADDDRLRLRLARARLAKVPGVPDDEGMRPVCDVPSAYDLVSVVFERPDAAEDALAIVRHESSGGAVGRIEVAALCKDASGRFTIHRQPDLTAGTGALGGAVAGALLGLVAGPVGVLSGAAVGAAAGGISERALDRGVPEAYVQELSDALASDSSAVVLLVQERFESLLLEKLAPLEGEVLRLALSDEMLDHLISWS